MRVMIVIRSSGLDMYIESILRAALDRGHDVDVLYLENGMSMAVSYKADNVNASNIESKYLCHKQLQLVSRLSILLRRLINYGLFVRRSEQSHHYVARYEGQLPRMVRNSQVIKKLIAFSIVTKILIRLDIAIQPSAAVYQRVKQLDPDVLITLPHNKTPALETEFVKAAKLLGKPSAVVPLSWDNLTTKGLINAKPTKFLVWNHSQLEAAHKYHFAPRLILSIVGAPVFDRWFEYKEQGASESMSVEFFHEIVGIPRGRKFILYLGSAVNISGNESWLINDLAAELAKHPDLKDVFILFRPHPGNHSFVDEIVHPNCVVYPKHGALPSKDKSRQEMFISFKSAICTVGVNTSGLLDAVINDVSTIAIRHSAYRSTQDQTIHFKELLDFGCMDHVAEVQDLPKKIREVLALKDPFTAKRQEFVETFIRPCGLANSAGKEIVVSLEKLV